jgi:hypothetical protein
MTETITVTQSYSLVLRDLFFNTIMQLPFFATFKGRKSRYYQIQHEHIPYFGIYIVSEDMVPDGDGNAGNIGFKHALQFGISVIIQNNDADVAEQKLDEAFWAIMNGLWTNPYLTNMIDTQSYGHPTLMVNPDNVRFESVDRATRRHVWGQAKSDNETPFCELQMTMTICYRTDFIPVIVDELERIYEEIVPMTNEGTVPPADEVKRVQVIYDVNQP